MSRMIGPAAGDRLGQMESSIIEAIKSATADDRFYSLALADALVFGGLGEDAAATIAERIESLAKQFDADGEFHASGRFYNTAAKWFNSLQG